MPFDITCSIVLYHTDISELNSIVDTLLKSELNLKIFLIDNSKTNILRNAVVSDSVEYIFNNKNVGYGAGHNIAIKRAYGLSKLHLVINADIAFDPIILAKGFNYIVDNDDVIMLSPQIVSNDGDLQHFCRLLPTPFDLVVRRFVPDIFVKSFKHRLDRYLLLDKDYSKPMVVPNLPGCFMLVKTDVLNQIGGFDENFFMYVEDVDLTRRLHQQGKTLYYPEIKITHGLARGSYKFSKLLIYHIKSAIYYFNKWGWFNDKQRELINRKL